jgi:transposase
MAPRTREFKIEMVKLVTERGMSHAHGARDMGIAIQTIRQWVKQFGTKGERAFPGRGHAHDAALVRLRRAHDRLRQARDMRKKALGSCSRMPQYAPTSSSSPTMRVGTQSLCCAGSVRFHDVDRMHGGPVQNVGGPTTIGSWERTFGRSMARVAIRTAVHGCLLHAARTACAGPNIVSRG